VPEAAREQTSSQMQRAEPAHQESAAHGGQGLQAGPRQQLQSSFGIDLSGVRVHTDSQSNEANQALGARAFTYGSDIFLGSSASPADVGLLAHEVAHVVQQRYAPLVQLSSIANASPSDPLERDARQAADAVHQGGRAVVHEHLAEVHVQRLGISDALDYFADKAYLIPGYRLFTLLLGVNPINMSRVERNAANLLRALIELLPGGAIITQALDAYQIFERVGAWIQNQMDTLGISGASIRQALDRFLDSLSWRDIFHLGDVWDRAKRIFSDPIDRILTFARNLVSGILRFVREAVLRPLARLAEGTRGWDLLKAVLGQDPITGEPVPRTAETLIGGFMKLIGQEDVWNNIKRANAIPRAWAWFQGVLSALLGFVRQIPSLFISALQQLELADFILLPRLFAKLARVFGGFLGSFISWAGQQVLALLQIIFEVVAPAVMPYLRRAAGALQAIFRNPVGFVGNLVRAGIQGFRQFAGNFLNHLRRSLIDWLTGTLVGAGVYIPQALELREIVKFVLSVLGLTWQAVRGKLVRLIGDRAVAALEAGFDLVLLLVREGPAAAWEKIRETLGNLRDMVMEQIMTFVSNQVVQAAITRLLTSLNPAGAFIQAIIATYNTVMFFVERLRQIAQVALAFLDSMVAIASGNIGTAASRVETVMAGLLTLVISFLARIAGLGRVSDAVKNIVDRIRAPIDRALDRVAEWIAATARSAGRLIAGGARQQGAPAGAQAPAAGGPVDLRDRAGQLVVDRLRGEHSDEQILAVITQILQELRPLGLQRLELQAPDTEGEAFIVAQASAPKAVAKKKARWKSKSAAVVLQARITYKTEALQAITAASGAPPRFNEYVIPTARGQPASMPSGLLRASPIGIPPQGQGRFGTMLIQPAAGAMEASVMSWNSGQPSPQTNTSHAEAFFVEALRGLNRTAISEIHIQINFSPCSICARGTLPNLLPLGIKGFLHYQQAYVGRERETRKLASNTTTTDDLANLAGKGWVVTGDEMPRFTDASKEAERRATQNIIDRNQ
jgi:Domain of unknown function (DUF4157)